MRVCTFVRLLQFTLGRRGFAAFSVFSYCAILGPTGVPRTPLICKLSPFLLAHWIVILWQFLRAFTFEATLEAPGDFILWFGDSIGWPGRPGDAVAWPGDFIVWLGDSIGWPGDAVAWREDFIVWPGDSISWLARKCREARFLRLSNFFASASGNVSIERRRAVSSSAEQRRAVQGQRR